MAVTVSAPEPAYPGPGPVSFIFCSFHVGSSYSKDGKSTGPHRVRMS